MIHIWPISSLNTPPPASPCCS